MPVLELYARPAIGPTPVWPIVVDVPVQGFSVRRFEGPLTEFIDVAYKTGPIHWKPVKFAPSSMSLPILAPVNMLNSCPIKVNPPSCTIARPEIGSYAISVGCATGRIPTKVPAPVAVLMVNSRFPLSAPYSVHALGVGDAAGW